MSRMRVRCAAPNVVVDMEHGFSAISSRHSLPQRFAGRVTAAYPRRPLSAAFATDL